MWRQCFEELKSSIAGKKFSTDQELFTAVQVSLTALSENSFLHGFEKLLPRCDKSIRLCGKKLQKKFGANLMHESSLHVV